MNETKLTAPEVSEKKRARGFFAHSLILTFFLQIAEWIYDKIQNSFIGHLFTSFPKRDDDERKGFFASLLKRTRIGDYFIKPFKRFFSKSVEDSRILSWIRGRLRAMLSFPMKVYGFFLFIFTLYASILYIFRFLFASDGADVDVGFIITTVFLMVASVSMITSRRSLSGALLDSRIAVFFLFRVFGLREEQLDNTKPAGGRMNLAFIFGTLLGCATYFVSPLRILGAIGILILALLILVTPECGVVLLFLLLPFADLQMLAATVIVTAFSLLIKVIRGKRSVRFDRLDGAVFLFALVTLFGGIVSVGTDGVSRMLLALTFLLGYYLTVNLIRSRKWLLRCAVGGSVSAGILSVFGIIEYFLGNAPKLWHDLSLFPQMSGKLTVTFVASERFGEYLLLMIPFFLALMALSKKGGQRFLCLIGFSAALVCLGMIGYRCMLIAAIVGLLLFFLLLTPKTLVACFFALAGGSVLLAVSPSFALRWLAQIMNLGDPVTAYHGKVIKGAFSLLSETAYTGIGLGENAFRSAFPFYAASDVANAPHADDLYMQIALGTGVIGLLLFLAICFLFTQSTLTVHTRSLQKEKILSIAALGGVCAFLVQGFADHVWYDPRLFLLFWLLIGFGAAVRRTLEKSEENLLS